MVGKYKVNIIITPGNRHLPIIIDHNNKIDLYSLRFILTRINNTSKSRLYRYCLAIRNFYNIRGVSLDTIIDHEKFYRQIEEYIIKHLLNKSKDDFYLFKAYIEWIFETKELDIQQYSVKKFNQYIARPQLQTEFRKFKSIEKKHLLFIDQMLLMKINTSKNISLSDFRNFIIYKILADTGIRKGELMRLTTSDLFNNEGRYYLQVGLQLESHNIKAFGNKLPPGIKTPWSKRNISISSTLYLLIDKYISEFRVKKNVTVGHNILLCNYSSGNPLSERLINRALQNIQNEYRLLSHNEKFKMTPHMLRHTFAEQYLEYLINEKGLDMESAKDQLRLMCGWKTNSSMPERYTRRFTASLANFQNIERLEKIKNGYQF